MLFQLFIIIILSSPITLIHISIQYSISILISILFHFFIIIKHNTILINELGISWPTNLFHTITNNLLLTYRNYRKSYPNPINYSNTQFSHHFYSTILSYWTIHTNPSTPFQSILYISLSYSIQNTLKLIYSYTYST